MYIYLYISHMYICNIYVIISNVSNGQPPQKEWTDNFKGIGSFYRNLVTTIERGVVWPSGWWCSKIQKL